MHSTKLFSQPDQKILLNIARQSIINGLNNKQAIATSLHHYSTALTQQRASFVTLKKHQHLRGCIGILEATRPLIEDVAENAFAAAFRDPRFDSVSAEEMDNISIHIAILSIPEPVEFSSEQDLLETIQPNIDGLILIKGNHKGTFLPAVWESLPKPKDFLDQLKLKAGINKNEWSEEITILRYQTESIEENSF